MVIKSLPAVSLLAFSKDSSIDFSDLLKPAFSTLKQSIRSNSTPSLPSLATAPTSVT
ncbi:MAG: hypothetical protein ACD_38C00163G0001 [uncultured bacterium]|nr:MAG: hypothetical protein ACD_38C00163G0001 [uncultured bacterium]